MISRSRLGPLATRAAVAADFGTIAHSGCFRSTCPLGRGWPKCAASRTFTQAWTCKPLARALAISRANGSKSPGCRSRSGLRAARVER